MGAGFFNVSCVVPLPAKSAHKGAGDTSGRRRRSRRVHERSRIALFDVFRQSFEERDASRQSASVQEKGVQVAQVSGRSNARRVGVDESTLRDHVRAHLATLMNSIRLDAVEDLDEFPEVKASVLNYGFQDLSNLSRDQITGHEISASIKQSLVDHEPRLVPASINVQVKTSGDIQQRVSVFVTADLIADPADIPIEFQADVDTDGGTVSMASRRI